MKIIQWKIILVTLIIGIWFVNGDNKDNKDKISSNNKKKCKNGNNGRGKGSGRSKGSGEIDCDDSGNNSSINILPEVVPSKVVETTESDVIVIEAEPLVMEFPSVIMESIPTVLPNKVASESDHIIAESEPITELNNIADTIEPLILVESEPITEQNNIADTTDPFTEEPLDGIVSVTVNDNEDNANTINTIFSSSSITPIPNIPNNEFKSNPASTPTAIKSSIRPTSIQVSTPNPPRRTTKSKIDKADGYTKNSGSARPADCINCRHPSTTTKIPTKNKTFKPIRNDGSHNIKNSNFDTHKPIHGIKNQRFFANEHNYWFGIYLPNRINTFYKPANYFRVSQNYWYGLFLPNLQAYFPNGCSVCKFTNQKTSTSNNIQEKRRVLY